MTDENKLPFTLTFAFDDPKTRDGFITWFLDCAGDQQYWQCLEMWKDADSRHDFGRTCPRAIFKNWPAGCPEHLKDIRIEAPTCEED